MPAGNTPMNSGTEKAERRGWLRRHASWVIVLAGLAAVIGIITLVPAKDRSVPPQEPPPVNVEVLRIKYVDEVADTFELEGDVEPNCVVNVSAEVEGRVENTREEGSRCGPDDPDPIIQLNKDLLRDRYATAEAQARMDKAEYERVSESYQDKKVATKSEYERAKANYDMSEAALSTAKTNLDRADIRAPIKGILNKVLKKKGDRANVNEVVAQIVDDSEFKVVVKVPELDIRYIKPDHTVTVMLNDRVRDSQWEKPDAIEAKVTYVDARADERARTTRVEITVPNQEYALSSGETRRLHDGDIVSVRLTRKKYSKVIVIPLKAIIPEENDRVVYVVNDGLAKRVEKIELGLFIGDKVTIRNNPRNGQSPLKEGDLLIVAGQQYVGPGQKVTIRKTYEGTSLE